MTDIRLVQFGSEFEAVTLDWLLLPTGELDTSNELATAVTVSLCTDGRANPDDELPIPGSDDRRGWWGDTDAEAIWNGWPIGSRLWLLMRAKIKPAAARGGATTTLIEAYALEALQPFVDRKICSAVTATATRVGLERIDLALILYRGSNVIELRYEDLWKTIAG